MRGSVPVALRCSLTTSFSTAYVFLSAHWFVVTDLSSRIRRFNGLYRDEDAVVPAYALLDMKTAVKGPERLTSLTIRLALHTSCFQRHVHLAKTAGLAGACAGSRSSLEDANKGSVLWMAAVVVEGSVFSESRELPSKSYRSSSAPVYHAS